MILNRAERMLARRYLLPGPGEGFIFLVASISLLAVALDGLRSPGPEALPGPAPDWHAYVRRWSGA